MTWTDTLSGYKYEAKKLVRQIVENDKLNPGRYATATISHLDDLPPETITATWTIITRHLRRSNVAALWVREITRLNKVHYHLLVRLGSQNDSHDALGLQINKIQQQIKQAADAVKPHRLRVQVRPKSIRGAGAVREYTAYMTKARVRGEIDGKPVKDVYANKRLLFKPKLGMDKYGTINSKQFWHKHKDTIWQEVREHEAAISPFSKMAKVKKQGRIISRLASPEYSRRTIERQIAEHLMAVGDVVGQLLNPLANQKSP
jgi:hypothetical protein